MKHSGFNHFMWLKTIGALNGIEIRSGITGVVSMSRSPYSVFQVQKNKKILKEAEVEYPDWRKAKEVLAEHIDSEDMD